MNKALERLTDLHDCFAQRAEVGTSQEAINRLCVTSVAGELHIDFYGSPFDESFHEMLAAVVTPEVSAKLASLTLRGPDEGSNGTRNWNLSVLADSEVAFPLLRELSVEQTKPTDHNRSIVASVYEYEEEGVLARLLARAPVLESLVTPSAPDTNFFQLGKRPLRLLSVDAGYDTQDFIRNLANSTCFPNLVCLEFGEYNEKYMDDYSSRCTPLADYHELFKSAAFQSVRQFVWRNPACSATDISALKKLRRNLQLMIVQTSAEYVH